MYCTTEEHILIVYIGISVFWILLENIYVSIIMLTQPSFYFDSFILFIFYTNFVSNTASFTFHF